MRSLSFFAVGCLASLAALVACSSSSSSSSSDTDGGADATALPSPPYQTGKITQALSNGTPVGVATVAIAGKTAHTNADGTYAIGIPKGTPYSMVVTGDGYFKLTEQDWISNQDVLDWGETQLLPTSIGSLLVSFLSGRDAAKGTLVVRVVPLPPCASEQGATVSLDPPGDTKLSYIEGGTPKATATSVTAGEDFSAVFYNIDPGAKVNIKVTSPTCGQKDYPVDAQGVTFTGTQTIESGEALTFARVFLADPIADAGTD
jgi:hypothetical protein